MIWEVIKELWKRIIPAKPVTIRSVVFDPSKLTSPPSFSVTVSCDPYADTDWGDEKALFTNSWEPQDGDIVVPFELISGRTGAYFTPRSSIKSEIAIEHITHLVRQGLYWRDDFAVTWNERFKDGEHQTRYSVAFRKNRSNEAMMFKLTFGGAA